MSSPSLVVEMCQHSFTILERCSYRSKQAFCVLALRVQLSRSAAAYRQAPSPLSFTLLEGRMFATSSYCGCARNDCDSLCSPSARLPVPASCRHSILSSSRCLPGNSDFIHRGLRLCAPHTAYMYVVRVGVHLDAAPPRTTRHRSRYSSSPTAG